MGPKLVGLSIRFVKYVRWLWRRNECCLSLEKRTIKNCDD